MNLKREIIEDIQADDLKGNEFLSDIVALIGIESTRILIENLSGIQFYIPTFKTYDSSIRRVLQKPENKGLSALKISQELGMSKRTIQKLRKTWN